MYKAIILLIQAGGIFMQKFIKKLVYNITGYELVKKSYLEKLSEPRNAFQDLKKLFENHLELSIFDIGAFKGYTVSKFHSLFPESNIYGFEPHNESFKTLNQLAKNNSSIQAINLGVSDKYGTTTFYNNSFDQTSSILPSDTTNSFIDGLTLTKEEYTINTTTIDSFCKEQNIEQIDILKIDIQGAELLALKGAKETLSKQKVRTILLEVNFAPIYKKQATFTEITELLSEYKFRIYNIYNLNYLEDGSLAWCDVIFLLSE